MMTDASAAVHKDVKRVVVVREQAPSGSTVWIVNHTTSLGFADRHEPANRQRPMLE